ncbi:MAG: hypothetical protein C0412_19785 [Flavobacterium sp.]|nr:hypothetical protein [Flavobacterium sp.]
MLLNESYKYSDREIIEKGSRALIQELGYSGFLRYIRNFDESHGEDYLKVQEDIYKEMSIDEVFEKASSNFKK